MKNRRLAGHDVSEVGLGTWQLGSADWGHVDEKLALEILHAAADSGVTLFDTADVYGDGESERRIGKFLKQRPKSERHFIATKLGRRGDPRDAANFTWDVMRGHVERSLRNLQLDCVDLLQLHAIPLSIMRDGEVFEHLRRLKREGLIANFGASVESVEEGLYCLQQEGVCALQVIFNIFRQKPIDELFVHAQARGVGLIVRLPLASGLLAGMTADRSFAPTDHRSYNESGQVFNAGETFAGLGFKLGCQLSGELKTLIPKDVVPARMTMAQLALRYCLDFPAVTTVIPGASKLSQVRSNVQVSGLPPLSPELHQRFREFYQERVAKNIRGSY